VNNLTDLRFPINGLIILLSNFSEEFLFIIKKRKEELKKNQTQHLKTKLKKFWKNRFFQSLRRFSKVFSMTSTHLNKPFSNNSFKLLDLPRNNREAPQEQDY